MAVENNILRRKTNKTPVVIILESPYSMTRKRGGLVATKLSMTGMSSKKLQHVPKVNTQMLKYNNRISFLSQALSRMLRQLLKKKKLKE